MDFKTYIDLQELLKKDVSTPQDRRAFGLSSEGKGKRPTVQLSAWTKIRSNKLAHPKLSEKIDKLLYTATLLLVFLAFVLGIVSGIGLLSYSGKEPVNLIYFLAMVVVLPLVTMGMSLIAMLRADRSKNMLVHISPAYWMERLVQLFFKDRDVLFDAFSFHPRVLNWMVIRRSQMLALAFSVGLLLALLGVVATRDIAFAWSTTLDMSNTQFHTFLKTIAFPWRHWLPSAVPSLELVAQSHYFRLGGTLSEKMVNHAALLGTWWKFLAMATLFYAVILRAVFYLIATWGVKRAIREAVLTLDGADELLKDMNEPIVTTHAREKEQAFILSDTTYARVTHVLKKQYDVVQGWAIPKEMLTTLCDAWGVTAKICEEVGGNNPLNKDEQIIAMSKGSVLLFVKAWEPPTMDFVDHLQMLSKRVDQVIVMPIGTAETAFKPMEKQLHIWIRKIATLDNQKVWIKV